MSTFSGLNTAYTGLVAARQGLNVVGQNIANVNTEGYTRQRASTSSVGPVAQTGLFAGGVRAGQGVSVDAIARLGDLHLDARVRSAAAAAGYASVRSDTLSALEDVLREPGDNGISARLQQFWAGWQDIANQPGEPAPAGVLLEQTTVFTQQLAHGYGEIEAQWTEVRGKADTMAAELNSAAAQVADLNARIRTTLAAGGSVNELLDKRSTLTADIASLAGGTVRQNTDGTVDVLIGGNALVSGDSFRPVKLTGATQLDGGTLQLEWAHRPGSPIALDGGELAGALSVLAPANASKTGGAIAEAAARFNAFAEDFAAQVNAVHSTGVTPTGAPGGNFFSYVPGRAAQTLAVVPQGVGDIATGTGGLDGSIADRISQLGTGPTSPNTVWTAVVTEFGVAAKAAQQSANLADLANTSAANQQLASASVDLDEENVNLLSFQHAYQGAARVMTAVDEMLDTLINRTGLVGR
ncbi:flagellar hook-associated protein FlgK [Arthrobacter sp. I2-34]|uniref:Flagellar hook-associated protein 1 n=1 Tax=Arthrobacter hankyongi TaxID=2904801 RepID=A0ABS9L4R0_9MICC|nr:flagellar hook-associated protein FlgK [Arthrobacter hankyongi]MCG2621620.1 flagellar hook-associated protein FlgK [Arthrobacter hankyongi]